MADCRNYRKNKNYMNCNSQNVLLLLIIYSMVLIVKSDYGKTLEAESKYNANCSNTLTCSKCTMKFQCAWSLQHQTCVYDPHFKLFNLKIYRKNECPRFSVVTKHTYSNTLNNLEYIVKVSNDHVGFMNFLKKSIFLCNSTTVDVYKKSINNDSIECSATILNKYFNLHNVQSFTAFIYIKFNGVLLRLDDIADHYVTFYEHKCDEKNKDDFCVTCTWNDDGFAHYVRLCSYRNSCEGHNELYMWHNNIGKSWHSKTQKIKDQCAYIDVNPQTLPATMAVDTNIAITVKNHLIFAENRKIMVTVAGIVCKYSKTFEPETIICVMSPPLNGTYGALSGPVLVKYTSDKESELSIQSSQIFQFYLNPLLNEDLKLGGIASGGTSVSVHGSHFVEPCVITFARLFVDLPNGVRSYADNYCDKPVNDTYMVCRSPNVLGAGLDGNASVVGQQLDFGLDITMKGIMVMVYGLSLRFYVHPDPVLLDFKLDVNGSVVVNGQNIQNILPDDIVVRSVGSPSNICVVVSVTRYSLVCKPKMSVEALQAISVTLGDSLVFTVTRRSDREEKILPDWLLPIMFTVLVFVYAFTFCQRKQQRDYAMLNIRKPPEVFI